MIGSLSHRIKIQKPSDEVGEFGHRVIDWADYLECWAEVRPLGSNERLIAFQMQNGQTHVVKARWQEAMSEVTGQYRIVFGDRIFNIVGRPRNVTEKDKFIIFDTHEGTDDAR